MGAHGALLRGVTLLSSPSPSHPAALTVKFLTKRFISEYDPNLGKAPSLGFPPSLFFFSLHVPDALRQSTLPTFPMNMAFKEKK